MSIECHIAESELIQTGIYGLDRIFLGGILKGNLVVVEGAAGTGKTLMGVEFIYRGIVEQDEPGIIVVFESSPRNLIRDAMGFGWNLDELQQQNKLRIIFTSPQVLDQDLRSPDSLLLEAAAEIGAQRIFIDGVSLLRRLAMGNEAYRTPDVPYRELLQQFIEGLQRENLTAMLSHEVTACHQHSVELEAAQFLADTVIILNREHRHRSIHRTLEIMKSRGQDYEAGIHTFRITADKGLEVFRRVQIQARGLQSQPTSVTKRSLIGCEPLDTLIGGGIFDGSTTLVAGISGAGKTVLGVQLLLEGALKHSKRGLLVSLDEHPEQILRNAETLGLNLKAQVDARKIKLLYDSPQELEIDAHFDLIVRACEEYKVERLVIDGMTSYSNALGDQSLYRDFIHSLVAFSKHRLMTTFFNYENPELFGVKHYMPDYSICSIVDNVILLNFVDTGDTLRRAITVAKARGSEHHFVTREYTIGPGGINLLPVGKSKGLPILPFQSYYGLLSRAPSRLSPDVLQRQEGDVSAKSP
jgi:circadian clock protein KaiC